MKKYIIGIVIVVVLVIIGISTWLFVQKNNLAKAEKNVRDVVTAYYEHYKIDDTELKNYFVDEDSYNLFLAQRYPFLGDTEMSDSFISNAEDYYVYLDGKIDVQANIEDIVIVDDEARASVKLNYLDCYHTDFADGLFEKYTDLTVESQVQLFFNDLKKEADKCIAGNEKKTEYASVTLQKKSGEWKIKDFASVVGNELKETKLGKQRLVDIKEYTQVTTDTNFRLVDFDLVSGNRQLSLNPLSLWAFPYEEDDTLNLRVEVKGDKGQSFVIKVLDENQNSIVEEEKKLSDGHQVFTLKVEPDHQLDMLQVYLIDKENYDKDQKEQTFDEQSFGRLYIYQTESE